MTIDFKNLKNSQEVLAEYGLEQDPEEVLIEYESQLNHIYDTMKLYGKEMACRKFLRELAGKMLLPYKTVIPTFLFCPFGFIGDVEIRDTDVDSNRIKFTYKGVSRTLVYYADVMEILTGIGINIPKSAGLPYREKQRLVEEYIVPLEKELTEYFTYEVSSD